MIPVWHNILEVCTQIPVHDPCCPTVEPVLTVDHSIALLFAFAFLRPDLKQCHFDDTSQLQPIAGQVCRD